MKYLLLSIAAVIIFNTIGIENKQEPVIIQDTSTSSYMENGVVEDTNDMVIPNPAIESSSFHFQSFITILLVLLIANVGCIFLAKKNGLFSMNEANKSNDIL